MKNDTRDTIVGSLALLLIALFIGHAIFHDFWWILWLPAVLAGIGFGCVFLSRFWKWLSAGGFWTVTKGLLLLVGIWEAWAIWSVLRARRDCVVCRNWVESVLMVESLADASDTPVTMCRKHGGQARRIWELEQDLGFQLSGCVGYRIRSDKKLADR